MIRFELHVKNRMIKQEVYEFMKMDESVSFEMNVDLRKAYTELLEMKFKKKHERTIEKINCEYQIHTFFESKGNDISNSELETNFESLLKINHD